MAKNETMSIKKKLSAGEASALLNTLKARFEKNMARHKGITWADVQQRLEAKPGKLWCLQALEQSGGEPDVVSRDKKTGEVVFYDCAAESPKERRSFCYDHEALEKRKENKPADSAVNAAAEMGAALLTEAQYRELQQLGEFDLKTSSWIDTPEAVRKPGGALFCDRRFGMVFTYHNGAESYYAARGFRCALKM